MDSSGPASKKGKAKAEARRAKAECAKPRILLAACGSVCAVKFGRVCRYFSEWAEVRAVVTRSSLRFLGDQTVPEDVLVFCDEHEWDIWKRIGDPVLHIDLRNWADILVIAPLSANTLGKMVGGLCDNLLTCIVRAWDYSKPFFVAPSMNSIIWRNPLTEEHGMAIDKLDIILIPPQPVRQTTASGESDEHHAMADPFKIYSTVRVYYELNMQKKG